MPAQVVLDSYYELVTQFDGPDFDWKSIASDPSIRDGDVVVYAEVSRQEAAGQVLFSHFGKIAQQDGKNLLVSKIGQGAVFESTLEDCHAEYQPTTNRLLIYRLNK